MPDILTQALDQLVKAVQDLLNHLHKVEYESGYTKQTCKFYAGQQVDEKNDEPYQSAYVTCCEDSEKPGSTSCGMNITIPTNNIQVHSFLNEVNDRLIQYEDWDENKGEPPQCTVAPQNVGINYSVFVNCEGGSVDNTKEVLDWLVAKHKQLREERKSKRRLEDYL